MDIRARRSRETSPDRAKVYFQPKMKPFRRVQIIYYLCRNGQLEHPHFMEISHSANQQLRLKDVMDRLTVLRGKGMPSLFSWSCKRSYKNGYVWNDLAENDVIYPAEGAEYVLKGSELLEGCAERFQHTPEPNFQSKRKFLIQNRVAVEAEEEEEYEEKASDSSSQSLTPHSRCSRGVSTEEIEQEQEHEQNPKSQNEICLEDSSPPSSTSTVSEKSQENNNKRNEECAPMLGKNSVFLQLIACGSSVAMKGRNAVPVNARKSSSLHKGVLCKSVMKMTDEDEIKYMSENPRFGNLQSEEKEYFSGSIVESMSEDRVATEPVLKKSSSYNEERNSKAGLGENPVERNQRIEEETIMKGKCIPRKKSSSKQTK